MKDNGKMKQPGEQGLTLVEVIVAIVVAGVGAAGFVSLYLSVTDGHAKAETRTIGSFLAQGLMDEVRSKRFDESYSPPFSAALGEEAPENPADKTTFDDVDDFEGWNETPVGFDAYILSVSVDYVTEGNLDEASALPTAFKRITIQVLVGEDIVADLASVVSGW